MNESDNQQIADLKSQIEDAPVEAPSELPFSLFEKPSNKTTNLLASSAHRNPVDGKNRWFDFKFKEPDVLP